MIDKVLLKEKILLQLFIVFVTIFELYHVAIGTNPSMVFRMLYTAVYLAFSVLSPPLIPTFTAVNLIVERFSSVFGEFLPNTLLFHIAVLVFGLLCINAKQPLLLTRSYDKRHFKWFVILYVYGIISILLHINVPPDFSFVINGSFMLVFLYYLCISKDKYIKSIVVYSVAAMAIVCTIGLFNYDNLVSDYSTSLGDVDRLDWKDANYFSFFIGIMLLITLYLAKYAASKVYRRIYIFIAFVMLVTMASLISRGAIVALLVALIYYYRKDLLSFRNLGYILLVAVALAGLYYLGVLDGLIIRFMSKDVLTGSGRTEIWEVGLKTFFSKDPLTIIFGAGEGQALSMTYMNGEYWSPHNNYLSIMFNFGLIGLFIFCLWLFMLFYRCRTRESRGLVLYIAVNSITIVPFTYVSPLWLMIPLIMVWDRRLYGRLM